MHDNIKEQFYNMLTGALSNVKMLDESTLDYYIKQLVSIPLFSNVLKNKVRNGKLNTSGLCI